MWFNNHSVEILHFYISGDALNEDGNVSQVVARFVYIWSRHVGKNFYDPYYPLKVCLLENVGITVII